MGLGTVHLLPQLGLNPKFEFPKNRTRHLSISQVPSSSSSLQVVCGLRNRARTPLWKSRLLSTEAIQAVQSMKLAAATPDALDRVFKTRVSRLLKRDLLDALAELQRQNEVELAVKVFNQARKEVWYTPDLCMYNDMLRMLGKNKAVEAVEMMFCELRKDGLEPDTRAYTELMGAYFKVGTVEKGIETYELLKESGCVPDKLALAIMLRNLKDTKHADIVKRVKKDCQLYLDGPEEFLQEVERKYPKRMPLTIV
ncbi:hypothetical protein DM860_002449 [Cuscuta australis]|uniref:PROP1-like PPR domain-containing protein n=1 Tax=Cuscuta australis TaxID=267555 RepID=A0A328D213_9ASTE|nr:hypothetical protein DM860_002449 [Cuscuta australis]